MVKYFFNKIFKKPVRYSLPQNINLQINILERTAAENFMKTTFKIVIITRAL